MLNCFCCCLTYITNILPYILTLYLLILYLFVYVCVCTRCLCFCYSFYTFLTIFFLDKRLAGEAPQFTRVVKPQVVRPGDNVVLECVVTGSPTPEVKWFRGEDEVKPDKNHIIEFHRETGVCRLTIINTTKVDETIYSVRATNKFGRAECRANLVLSMTLFIFLLLLNF